MSKLHLKSLVLVLSPIIAISVVLLNPFHLTPAQNKMLAIMLWMICYWLTECIPLGITALLPLILFPVFDIMSARQVSALYGNHLVFLFIAALLLAQASLKTGLHERVAKQILAMIGTTQERLIFIAMLMTALISMWLNNTVTVLIMLPVALGCIKEINQLNPSLLETAKLKYHKTLLLGIAYSAVIGGIVTPIGSSLNATALGLMDNLLGYHINFFSWLTVGLPLFILLFPLNWFLLTKIFFRQAKREDNDRPIKTIDISNMEPMTKDQKFVLFVAILVIVSWVGYQYLPIAALIPLNATSIAIIGVILLFIKPSQKKDESLLTISDLKTVPWHITFLFGGGIAIAAGIQKTEFSTLISQHWQFLGNMPLFLMLLIIAVSISLLAAFVTGGVTLTVLLPLFLGFSKQLGINPLLFIYVTLIASSFAFMLPTAAAVNAIVFSDGKLHIKDMVKAGFVLSICSAILLAVRLWVLSL